MPDPYISEVDYRGPAGTDHIEIAVTAGTDVSTVQVAVYHPNGTVRWIDGLGSLQDTIAGQDVYVIAGMGVHKNGAIALVVDGEVTQFISFDNAVTATEGPAAGMTSVQVGSVGNDQAASLISTDGGASYDFQAVSDPGVIPCFLAGTMIDTDTGPRKVQDLRPGDLIRTEDGLSPLRWIGRSAVKASREALYPVRLPAGALGRAQPDRDLLVSQNHRIALEGTDCELLFGSARVLVAAKHLVGQFGIRLDRSFSRPVYYHLLFDQHELVRSNGLVTESFHPGDVILGAEGTFDELQMLFPDLVADTRRQTHSPCLKGFEAEVLIRSWSAPR